MDCPNCELEMNTEISNSPFSRGIAHTCGECGYSEYRQDAPLLVA